MKRKRGCGKRKPKMPPVVGTKEGIPNLVTLNTQDDYIPDHYDDTEYDTRMETETVQNNNRNECRQQSANLSKKARSNTTKLSKGFTSSIKPSNKKELEQGRRTRQKDPKVPHKDALYKDQELKAALDVIRKVMEMDAAEPFNAPVDPIALGIPDYFDVIDTPMDFGTVCKDLENGVKYKNSKDVFRDVQYIWENCSKYNNTGHYILELMKRVKKNFTKHWTEAGLYWEQPQEITGHSHVPPMESTKRYCTRGQKSIVGSMTDNPRHQQQDQMDLSQRQPHQPSQSYNIPYQSQQKSCQYHLSSSQQQTFHPQSGRNDVSAGNSYLTPMETNVRRSPSKHRFPVGPNADNASGLRQNQTGLHQLQHQPSSSYSQPFQPYHGSCQCQPSFGQPQPSHTQAGTYISIAGHSHLPPMGSMVRCSPHGHRHPVGLMDEDDNPIHLQHNQSGVSKLQLHPHHPSLYCSQASQPQQRSFSYQPNVGPLQPSQPHAGTDLASAGHLCSPSAAESMIRCSKCGPRSPVGPMTNYTSHEQQDQIALSQMLPCQPSASCGQPHQLQEGTGLVQLNSSLPQPSQQQVGMEMGNAGRLCSPPPGESMIRCRKHGPTSLANTMIDYASHERRDQTAMSQMLSHHPSEINGEPHQPEQGTCQVQKPSSSQPQPSQPSTHKDMGCAGVSCHDSISFRRTRGRGPTRCLDVWNMEGKISVATNELGQPVGPEAPKLSNFLGTIARNGHMAPLNYVDWRAVPDESKEKMWQQVQSKFDIDPISVSWVLKSIGRKWKDWKAELKASRYATHETNEERLADLDERVLPDQWRILVSFWNSKEAKDRSVTNKANRAHQKICHATGTKSFARIREEQRAKMPDGKEPSRAELFILTRTRKDGRPVNEASSALISQLREQAAQRQNSPNGVIEDDVFVQVMGHDRHGRVRTYGLGPSPSDFGGLKPSRAEAIKMVSEANAEVRGMKERMVAVEQTCAQMAAQMATMMSMMSNMQNKDFDEHGSPSEPLHARRVANVSSNSGKSPQLQAHPASYVQEVSSHQRHAMKRGKVQSASSSRVLRKRN